MDDFLKKHGKKISLGLLALMFGTYLWFIFQGGFPSGDGLEKKDWLAFWGSFLSFAGTTVLGAISVWQNNRANDVNKNAIAENRRIIQVQFENELCKNKYMLIIEGTNQIAKKMADIHRQFITTVVANFPNPDEDKQLQLEASSRILDSIITDIDFLRLVEIDNALPLCYDDEFPVLKENRKKIKRTLSKTMQDIMDYKQEILSLRGRGEDNCVLYLSPNFPQDCLVEISTYFHKKLNSALSYKSFNEEDSDNAQPTT